jgi:hypothetical protein
MKFAEFIHRSRGNALIIVPKVQVRVVNKDFAVPWKDLPKQISVIFEHRETDVDIVFFGLEDDLPDNRSLRVVCRGFSTNTDRNGLRQTIESYGCDNLSQPRTNFANSSRPEYFFC